MIAPVRSGIALNQPNGPVIETARLKLRRWRAADIAANTAMLSDPGTARYITADGKPVTDEFVGWRNAAIMSGHCILHGVGMFVVGWARGFRRAGRVSKWAGESGRNFAAKATRQRRRGRQSTGRLRLSNLIASSIASTARTRPRRRSLGGLALNGRTSLICSAISPTSG